MAGSETVGLESLRENQWVVHHLVGVHEGVAVLVLVLVLLLGADVAQQQFDMSQLAQAA